MDKAGLNFRRGSEEARGVDPEVLTDMGETHADSPEQAAAHGRALRALMIGDFATKDVIDEPEVKEPPKPHTPDVRSPRTKRRYTQGPQFGEEEGVGYPDGKPHYYQKRKPLTPEQREVLLRGVAHARKVLADKEEAHNP